MSSGALLNVDISSEHIIRLFSAGNKTLDGRISAVPAPKKYACYFCFERPQAPNRLWLVKVQSEVQTEGKYKGSTSQEHYGICNNCYIRKQANLN